MESQHKIRQRDGRTLYILIDKDMSSKLGLEPGDEFEIFSPYAYLLGIRKPIENSNFEPLFKRKLQKSENHGKKYYNIRINLPKIIGKTLKWKVGDMILQRFEENQMFRWITFLNLDQTDIDIRLIKDNPKIKKILPSQIDIDLSSLSNNFEKNLENRKIVFPYEYLVNKSDMLSEIQIKNLIDTYTETKNKHNRFNEYVFNRRLQILLKKLSRCEHIRKLYRCEELRLKTIDETATDKEKEENMKLRKKVIQEWKMMK